MGAKRNVIAFFDIDHTLLDGSSGNLYTRYAIRERLMRRRDLLWVAWYALLYQLNRLPARVVYGKVFEHASKHPVLEIIRVTDGSFEELMLPRLYQEGVDLVREHREKGHWTVIATAVSEYVAERVRAQLGADDFIATPLPVEGDRITASLGAAMTYMEGKLEAASAYAASREADLADCYFYSDSASDFVLLDAVGHPVMVNPQLSLRLKARGMGWPVIRFKEHARFEEVKRPERLRTSEFERWNRIYESGRSERLIPSEETEALMESKVIAFFDLDHTLLDGSNGSLYAQNMVKKGFMKRRDLFWVVWYTFLYKLNRLPRREVYQRVLDMMGRVDVLEMIRLMDLAFAESIMPRLYSGGVELVGEHHQKGHLTVIATAAGEYIAERVRVQLGADDMIATPIPVSGDRITGELEGPSTYMEGKLEAARTYADLHGADLSDCYFYSDSASDLCLLEAVGHPVMVNPQWKLRMMTRGRGWPVMKFKQYATFDEVLRPERLITPEMDRFTRIYEASLSRT